MKPIVIILAIAVLVTVYPAWGPRSERSALLTQDEYFGPAVPNIAEAAAVARSVEAMRIEVYDRDRAEARNFEVKRVADKGWIIPSHHDYPADGGERVGRTAGSVLGIKKGEFISNDAALHGRLGVLAPDDVAAANDADRGTRVTLTNAAGAVVLDIVIGNADQQRPQLLYIRNVSDNDVYLSEITPDLSTTFTDYVEQDLLKIERDSITSVVVDPHQVDELNGQVIEKPLGTLTRTNAEATWQSAQTPAGQQVDAAAVEQLLAAIDRVELTGVRVLQPLTVQRLQRYGFFTSDGVSLYGNEGGLYITDNRGMVTQIYFGEVAPDDGLALSAGLEAAENSVASGENRFMAIFVRYDDAQDQELRDLLQGLADEAMKDLEDGAGLSEEQEQNLRKQQALARKDHLDERKALQDELRARFGSYFFVIANSVFEDLHPEVESLFSVPTAEGAPDPGSNPANLMPPGLRQP